MLALFMICWLAGWMDCTIRDWCELFVHILVLAAVVCDCGKPRWVIWIIVSLEDGGCGS